MRKDLAERGQQDFKSLIDNGMDFLEKAYSQLENDPKYSIINFYTAVELLLKAPLVLTHWSLIIADREPNIQKYRSGDFKSIGFEETCSRLNGVLEKPLSADARNAFDVIRKHRNKMVHFYHAESSADDFVGVREEQAEAWFELNKFLAKDHKEVFDPYMHNLKSMERMLRLNEYYANIIYKKLEPEINEGIKNGRVFLDCVVCKKHAYEHLNLYPQIPSLSNYKCLVCSHQDSELGVNCPACNSKSEYLKPDSSFHCSACQHEIAQNKIYKFLDEACYGPDNYFDAITPANCDECQSFQSVCEFKGGYLCTNCLSFFDGLYACGYCNDYGTELMEDSCWTGCLHCEGNAGRHSED